MNALANALIVVDVQVDFCPGGSLAVEHGDEVARKIHTFMDARSDEYILIVATKCWHPAPNEQPDFDHFSDKPNFVNTWPPHCVAGTVGADFHPNLGAMETTSWRSQHGTRRTAVGDLFEFDKIFYKGQTSSAYSGFEGHEGGSGLDAGTVAEVGHDPTSLHACLQRHHIGHVDVVGIATDYCVFSTAMDAQKLGYSTTVLLDMCAGVAPETTETAVEQLAVAGVVVDKN